MKTSESDKLLASEIMKRFKCVEWLNLNTIVSSFIVGRLSQSAKQFSCLITPLCKTKNKEKNYEKMITETQNATTTKR